MTTLEDTTEREPLALGSSEGLGGWRTRLQKDERHD